MDLKVILLILCSVSIFERVNGLEEERIILRLSQIESGLEECNKKNDENSARIEEYAVHTMHLSGVLNETKDTLDEHTDSLNKASNEITLLKANVQVLQKFAKVGTSCSQLASLGFDLSDTYFLDYDGLGQGHPPFKAQYIHQDRKLLAPVALLRPYYIAKRTREMLISNIHLLSPQKWSQFVHFNI